MDLSNICLNCFQDKGEFDVCYHCGYVTGTPPEQAFHLHPGSILQGRYIIGTVVGFGGFGITYKVWDATLGTVTAIKEFFPAGLVSRVPGETQVVVFSGEKQQQYKHQMGRFMDEARNMAKFAGSKHIVNVFDFFEENNTSYIAMEFLDGQTLKDYARDETKKPIAMDVDTCLFVLEPMTHALEQMHGKGIIHRDVSPDNIFVTRDGQVKLLDFGAARLSEGEKEETLMAIIKPGYAPPEQYRSKSRQGPYTDVYGLGATMYRLLTGETPEESVDRQVDDQLKRPSALGITLDDKLEKSIMKAMAIKQELRFQTMAEFREAVLGNQKVEFPEEELKRRKRTRTFIVAAAVLAVVGLTIGVGAYSRSQAIEILPDTLTVWMPYGGGTDFDTGFMLELSESFHEQYPQLDLDFVPVNYMDMGNKLIRAESAGDMPILFHADCFDGQPGGLAQPLDSFLGSLDKTQYLFFDQYDSLYPQRNVLPTSLEVPVVYINTNAAAEFGFEPGDSIVDVNVLSSIPWRIQTGAYDDFLALYGGFYPGSVDGGQQSAGIDYIIGSGLTGSQSPGKDAISILRDDELTLLFGTTADYRTVQDEMSGYFRAVPVTRVGAAYGVFHDTWALSANIGENRANIGSLFLTYLLTTHVQENLYAEYSDYLPVSRNAFANYLEIFPGMDFLGENVKSMKLWGVKEPILRCAGEEVEDLVEDHRYQIMNGEEDASILQESIREVLSHCGELQ